MQQKIRWKAQELGLPWLRQLVEMMDGKVYAESDEGVGSHFYFEIPEVPADELNISMKETEKAYMLYFWGQRK